MEFPLEAVPNFSEGRDAATIAALGEALGAALEPRARLLDVHADPDHNRSVFTLVGGEKELIAALLAGASEAKKGIDMRDHEGVHPCVGAADVLPIVAIRPEDVERARAAALELAGRLGDELDLPVFLYGQLGEGRQLSELRRGGLEGLSRRMESGEAKSDFGPGSNRPAQLDRRFGAVLVGAREPLIAFNVNIRAGVEVAKEIAASVRESGGGFRGVRALGLELPRAESGEQLATGEDVTSTWRRLSQVSMNIEDWRAAPLCDIVSRIEREAAVRGAEVAGSELVGLVPEGAVAGASRSAPHLPRFDRSQILERRLADEFGLNFGSGPGER